MAVARASAKLALTGEAGARGALDLIGEAAASALDPNVAFVGETDRALALDFRGEGGRAVRA